jgi:hypothetical protein
MIFIEQGTVYIDQAHQQFRLTTTREKEQSSNSKSRKARGPHVKLQYTQTAYSDEYSNTMRPATTLPLPHNSHLKPTPNRQTEIKNFSYLSVLQKDPLSEFFLKKKNPDIGLGATGYKSSGEIFSALRLRIFKTLKFFVPNNKRLGGHTQ